MIGTLAAFRSGPRTPVLCTCQSCGHVWVTVWAPCEIRDIGLATPKLCPWCGERRRKQLTVASRERGDVARYAAFLKAELARAEHDRDNPPPAEDRSRGVEVIATTGDTDGHQE